MSKVTPRQQQINNLRGSQSTDDFDRLFDKLGQNTGKIIKFGIGFWIVSAILSLALTGVIIWGIIYLVLALV